MTLQKNWLKQQRGNDQEIDDAADSTDQKMVSNEVFRTGHCTQ